jgi:hypothetical protein
MFQSATALGLVRKTSGAQALRALNNASLPESESGQRDQINQQPQGNLK